MDSGWWWLIVHGQWAFVVVVACVLPWALGIIYGRCWLVVVIFGWGGGRFWAVVVVFVNKCKRKRRGLPEFMWTVTMTHVVTVWTTCHVR